jgi:2',3'-cyclic-nucleotide 2'-phosphodiesterase (5'-nucleotidase family)
LEEGGKTLFNYQECHRCRENTMLRAGIRGVLLAVLSNASPPAFNLTLLLTNKIRGELMPINEYSTACSLYDTLNSPEKCFGGAARRAAYIKAVRIKSNNVLLLDIGGSFFGSLFWTASGVETSLYEKNTLSYDAAFVSQHEFHGGSLAFGRFIDGLNESTAVVASNLNVSMDPHLRTTRPSGQPKITPWIIKHKNGTKIGLVSLSPSDLQTISIGATDVIVNGERDGETMGRRAVASLRKAHPDCDIIIAAGDPEYTDPFTKYIEHIDIFIMKSSGGDADVVKSTNIYGQTVVTFPMNLAHGVGVGHATVGFDSKGAVIPSAVTFAAAKLTSSTPLDPAVWNKTLYYLSEVDTTLRTPVGYTQREIFGAKGSLDEPGGCRFSDCPAGRLITDAIMVSGLQV